VELFYIALTKFARQKFIQEVSAEKIVVKPNSVHPDPGPGDGVEGTPLQVGFPQKRIGLSSLHLGKSSEERLI